MSLNFNRSYPWAAKPTRLRTVAISVAGKVCFMSAKDARDIVAEEKERAKLRGTYSLIWKMSKAEVRQHWISVAKTKELCEMARKAGEAWARLSRDPKALSEMLKGGEKYFESMSPEVGK